MTGDTAQPLPGLAGAGVGSLSCWSAGNCVATEAVPFGSSGPLVVSEVHGVWGTAAQVPGGGIARSVSCAPDGYCVVGGYDTAGAFVASVRNGIWGAAVTWPGWGPVLSVSCPSAGNCAGRGGGYVVTQADGVWGTPGKLPGPVTTYETIKSLSCGSAGNCGVGGIYELPGGRDEPFVASEINGRWSAPEPVPGITALNKHKDSYNGVFAVSCPSAAHCTAAGTYTDADGGYLGFVTGPA